ncbi:hypothetical protein [Crateriforma spongiae]|uniref:hypothetical protein n=1 Tax=Crateriforma spongiae TaxID=2724528 RepID=UPI0039B0A165
MSELMEATSTDQKTEAPVQPIVHRRSNALPRKFGEHERAAYDWLQDVQIDGWAVDFVTKRVISLDDGVFQSIIEYARHNGFGK